MIVILPVYWIILYLQYLIVNEGGSELPCMTGVIIINIIIIIITIIITIIIIIIIVVIDVIVIVIIKKNFCLLISTL